MSIRFHLRSLQEEMKVLPALAGRYIDPVCVHRIDNARSMIDSATQHEDNAFTWTVSEKEPIRTIVSKGTYENRKHGQKPKGPSVVGLLSFKWEMRTCRGKPVDQAFLDGKASTKIRLVKPDDDALISMWRMEIGPEEAPGCCFHTQVLGEEDEPPFPRWMPVPRLPSFPATPMTCLEFLISELFQRGWSERVLRKGRDTHTWRGIQATRLSTFLAWQQSVIDGMKDSSPLVRLKAFPEADALSSL